MPKAMMFEAIRFWRRFMPAAVAVGCAWMAIQSGRVSAAPEAAAAAAAAPADRELLADRPVAVWRFEDEPDVKNKTVQGESVPAAEVATADTDEVPAAEPIDTRIVGDVVFGQPGPQPPRHPGMPAANRAAAFGNGRSHLTTASTPALQFHNGDSITLEAWVNVFEIAPGQHVYVIGKGRTGRPAVAADNQNWALRCTGGSCRRPGSPPAGIWTRAWRPSRRPHLRRCPMTRCSSK